MNREAFESMPPDQRWHEHLTAQQATETWRSVAQRKGAGMGGPWWVRIAVGPTFGIFLVLWLLGAFPWMPSPLLELKQALASVSGTIATHEVTTRRLLSTNVLICRGMWRGNEEMQRQCSNGYREMP